MARAALIQRARDFDWLVGWGWWCGGAIGGGGGAIGGGGCEALNPVCF